MSKFKIGDFVRAEDEEGVVYGSVTRVDIDNYAYEFSGGGYVVVRGGQFRFNEITKQEKTMDNLEQGDVLVKDSYGEEEERVVLAVVGGVVIVDDGDDDACTDTLIISKLKDNGYTLKNTEEVKEMTVADVEKLVGKKVKIVKD